MARKFVWGVSLALIGLVSLAGSGAADWGPTEIQVFCYAGERADNQYLGTVDIYDARRAASYCNMLYGDCHGNCTACYDDEDSREICIDSSGRGGYY
ncbi:MAG TPA: hypothetical protein VGJ94_01615 [Syntrophorhabdaceae bacterium]|jgi:hypothetical protein